MSEVIFRSRLLLVYNRLVFDINLQIQIEYLNFLEYRDFSVNTFLPYSIGYCVHKFYQVVKVKLGHQDIDLTRTLL